MNPHELFNKAQAAQAANEFVQATQLFHQFLDQTESETTVSATTVSNNHQRRLTALAENGIMYRFLGDHEASLANYQQMLHEARTSQEKTIGMARVAGQHSNMGQHDQALTLSTEAMHLAEIDNDTFGRALATQIMGMALLQFGRFDEALSRLETAVSLFWQLGDVTEEMRTWNMIGVAYGLKGELDKAIAALDKALLLVRSVGDIDTVFVLGNLGETYQDLFNDEKAMIYHQEALALAQKMPLPSLKIDPQRNLGILFCRLGNVTQALEYLNQALEQSEQLGEHDLTLQALYSLAISEQRCGDLEKAEQLAHRLLEMAQKSKTRGSEAQALYVLGLCIQKRPDTVDNEILAEQYWHQALFLAHDTGQKALLWQIHAALAQVGENPQLNKTHYRIAAEVIEQIVYPLEDDSLRQSFLNALPIRAILDQVR